MDLVLDSMAWWELLWATPRGEALRERIEAPGVRLHASTLALAEVTAKLHAIGHGPRAEQAAAAIRGAARLHGVTAPIAEEIGALRQSLREKDPAASLADAIHLQTARALGFRLVSTDPAYSGEPDVDPF